MCKQERKLSVKNKKMIRMGAKIRSARGSLEDEMDVGNSCTEKSMQKKDEAKHRMRYAAT